MQVDVLNPKDPFTKSITQAVIAGDLENFKKLSLSCTEKYRLLPFRLWALAAVHPFTEEMIQSLKEIAPLDEASRHWSLVDNFFSGMSQNNPNLFDEMALNPVFQKRQADQIYAGLLKNPNRQTDHDENLWNILRDCVTQYWQRKNENSAFSCIMVSQNQRALRWIMEKTNDWTAFGKTLSQVGHYDTPQAHQQSFSALEAVLDLEIDWKAIGEECDFDKIQTYRSQVEQLRLQKINSSTQSPPSQKVRL